jgi:hypothetical protein
MIRAQVVRGQMIRAAMAGGPTESPANADRQKGGT